MPVKVDELSLGCIWQNQNFSLKVTLTEAVTENVAIKYSKDTSYVQKIMLPRVRNYVNPKEHHFTLMLDFSV